MADYEDENDAFHEIIRAAIPDRMISNFVLIAEIVGQDTEELSIFTSDAMTPWLALGMLQSASETVRSSQTQARVDEEE